MGRNPAQSRQHSGCWSQLLLSPGCILASSSPPQNGSAYLLPVNDIHWYTPNKSLLWCELVYLTFLSLPSKKVPTDCTYGIESIHPIQGQESDPGRARANNIMIQKHFILNE